jgi:23S rRNA pseudouridine2605 synthase
MITDGRVTVNGAKAVLGQKADACKDRIAIDGNPLASRGKRVYIMLNKPRGYVTTLNDERGRKTVYDLVRDCGERVYPIGRLDLNSEGLLLMTNDGILANRLTHPSFHVPKKYMVRVRGEHPEASSSRLDGVLELDGVPLQPAKIRIAHVSGNTAVLTIVIHEGKNRQIRKMCQKVGLEVLRLQRIQQGNIRLGDLKSGTWRYLLPGEIDELRAL